MQIELMETIRYDYDVKYDREEFVEKSNMFTFDRHDLMGNLYWRKLFERRVDLKYRGYKSIISYRLLIQLSG